MIYNLLGKDFKNSAELLCSSSSEFYTKTVIFEQTEEAEISDIKVVGKFDLKLSGKRVYNLKFYNSKNSTEFHILEYIFPVSFEINIIMRESFLHRFYLSY